MSGVVQPKITGKHELCHACFNSGEHEVMNELGQIETLPCRTCASVPSYQNPAEVRGKNIDQIVAIIDQRFPFPKIRKPVEDRFFEKVQKTESCWIWLGARCQGYGSFSPASYRSIQAYRWAYEYFRGPVPSGMQLDHLCRNRLCVNPDHLEVVTQKTNVLRGNAPPAINARKTHCKHGHEFTAENTYHRKDSKGRKCKTCIARYNNSKGVNMSELIINERKTNGIDVQALQRVLLGGDLSTLAPEHKIQYYNRVCELVGLNPLTKPFDYIRLNGKEVLYANKGCGEQLRMVHKISLEIAAREKIEDVYVVTAKASYPDGRVDCSTGAVALAGLKGESLANAMMKAETKAKRRVTLSICGLNMLDETEVETIPNAMPPLVQKPVPSVEPPENPGLVTVSSQQLPICNRCGSTMRLSKSKKHYFCGNFKDTKNGEHPTIPVEKVNEYIKENADPAEEAVMEWEAQS